MATTTSMRIGVNTMEKTATYNSNCTIRLGFRIEHHRVGSNYMTQHQKSLEEAFPTWIAE
jgi:hypothetical protein